MDSSEEQPEHEAIETPKELLLAIDNGEIEIDPIGINYEIKRLIYEDEVECDDFAPLFHQLCEMFNDEQIVEITQVLFPGFCNWVEIMVTQGKLSVYEFSDLYSFYQNILTEFDEDSCTPCKANIKLVQEIFQEEVERRFENKEYPLDDQIRLSSMLDTHDKFAEILVQYHENPDDHDEIDDVSDYLDLIDVEKILDPVLKNAIKDMIRDSEW